MHTVKVLLRFHSRSRSMAAILKVSDANQGAVRAECFCDSCLRSPRPQTDHPPNRTASKHQHEHLYYGRLCSVVYKRTKRLGLWPTFDLRFFAYQATLRREITTIRYRAINHALESDTEQQSIMKKAAIGRIPPELWYIVFENMDLMDRLVATHVCSDWRSIALRSSRLWRDLDFYSDHDTDCINHWSDPPFIAVTHGNGLITEHALPHDPHSDNKRVRFHLQHSLEIRSTGL